MFCSAMFVKNLCKNSIPQQDLPQWVISWEQLWTEIQILKNSNLWTKSKTLHLRVSFIFVLLQKETLILKDFCLHQICLFGYCVKGVCNQWVCGHFNPPSHTVILTGLSFNWAQSELNCLSGWWRFLMTGLATAKSVKLKRGKTRLCTSPSVMRMLPPNC